VAGLMAELRGAGVRDASDSKLVDSASLFAATLAFAKGASGLLVLEPVAVVGTDDAAEGREGSLATTEESGEDHQGVVAGSAEQQNRTSVERIKELSSGLQARGGTG
jgi:hypothetical protein